MQNLSAAAARMIWDPLHLFPQLNSPVLQLLQPRRLSAAAGTAHPVLAYSSFIQTLSRNLNQGRESIRFVMHVTSGKIKTSVKALVLLVMGTHHCCSTVHNHTPGTRALSARRMTKPRERSETPRPSSTKAAKFWHWKNKFHPPFIKAVYQPKQ